MRLPGSLAASAVWIRWARPAIRLLWELLAWGAAIAALEAFGRHATTDGSDLLGLSIATGFGMAILHLARRGWLPATRRAARWTAATARRLGQAFALRHRVALRRPRGETPRRGDRSLLLPAMVLLLLAAATIPAGGAIFDGLAAARSAFYTGYLVLIGLLWAVLAAVTLGGILASHGVATEFVAGRGARWVSAVVLFGSWLAAALLVAAVPGIAVLAVVVALGLVQSMRLSRRPETDYLLTRRDAQGRTRVVPVQAYLRRAHAVVILALVLAAGLGRAGNLWEAGIARDAFLLTHGLGLFAGAAAILLAALAGRRFLRVLGPGTDWPEIPLTPTVWLRAPGSTPPWARAASRRGWFVETDPEPPTGGYDLVVGEPGDPRTFRPEDGAPEGDEQFRLDRRFHVVKRRLFWRRFQSLFKEATAEPHAGGTGFLFCPHVWLVQGLVRDTEESADGERPGGAIIGHGIVGRPYAEVFPTRLRRYLGMVFRRLEIDMVYWEDAVGWTDIRAVLGVAFEVHDQGRAPLQERHFLGVPRVRVVIQDDEEAPTPGVAPAPDDPPAVHARILVILKDRGDGNDPADVPTPGSRVPEPVGA